MALTLGALAVAAAGCGPPPPACIGSVARPAAQAPSAERPIAESSPGVAALALRYQPTVRISTLDRFWPVSVAAVLGESDLHGGHVRLISGSHVLADPAAVADLRPSGAASEYLEYPALLSDKAAQMRVFLRGLGVPQAAIDAWPRDLSAVTHRSAQIYFYDAGTGCTYAGRDTGRYRALQYWFFYALNYYPMTVDSPTMLATPLRADTADIDFHEGDWEHITVLLDVQRSTYVPKFVWMARHASEGVLIPWDQVELDSGGHPVVYPAFGGHPSYPNCGAHGRALLAASVYDYVVCGPGLYTLSAATTRLVDLSQVSWSCWPGYFGTTAGTAASTNADDPTGSILVGGPRSPLRQAENQLTCRIPKR